MMGTMASSRLIHKVEEQNQLHCLLRNTWVAGLPEEVVRQRLVHQMMHQLGYPKGSLSLETSLHQIPHLQSVSHQLPQRRTDLICFAKGIHPQWDLYPLLVVECKAVKLTNKAMTQLVGYNHFLRACFIALTDGNEMHFGWQGDGEYRFIDRLPSYEELKGYVRTCSKSSNDQILRQGA